MDARHFDRLTRALSEAGSRRGLLRLLATLSALGGLLALLGPDETDAKGRRRRRKKAHKHGRGRHHKRRKHKHKKKCEPQSLAQTCAGTCGSVKNNCQQTVDCGSCACDPPCKACFVCDEKSNTPGGCVADPNQEGDPCGEPGQVCQADGSCACDAGSCAPCASCQGDGACSAPCDGSGCCEGGICRDGESSGNCGTDGKSCVSCSGTTPICDGGSCVPCSATNSCPDSCCDAATGACVAHCPDSAPICSPEHICVPCEDHPECGDDALCVDGQCHACDVVNGDNLADAIGGAQDGATLYLCAGTFGNAGPINIGTSLTLIGAGQGADGTVVQATLNLPTLLPPAGSTPVMLRTLRIQNATPGVQNAAGRHLTMIDCTVRGNRGGIENNFSSTLEMTRCTVENNTAPASGGGLSNESGTATLTDCHFVGNAARAGGGVNNETGTLTLSGTVVTNNTASNGGSGIFNDGGTVTLQNDSSVCANNPTTDQCHGFADPGGACQVTCPAS